jgi:hypothetical protein
MVLPLGPKAKAEHADYQEKGDNAHGVSSRLSLSADR